MTVPAECINSPYGQRITRKTVTFDNTAGGTVDLFTVTGAVTASIVCKCTTSLTSAAAAALEVGVAELTSMFIAGGAAADIVAGYWTTFHGDNMWTTPPITAPFVSNGGFAFTPNVLDGQDIITTLSAQVDSGSLQFYCLWTPLSADGNVVAAS